MVKNYSEVFNTTDKFKKYAEVSSLHIKDSVFSHKPLITIAIPTYNRIDTLKETLDSVFVQKGIEEVEVIVVDNNPERDDSTEKFMSNYHMPNLAYYKNEKNIGMTGNWNRMYELAKGEWVCMIHDDDCLMPWYLGNVYKVLDTLENDADAFFFISSKNPQVKKESTDLRVRKLSKYDLYTDNALCIPGNLIKRQVVVNLGGFNEEYYPCADYYFWLHLLFVANPYKVEGVSMTYYRIAQNTSMRKDVLLSFAQTRKFLDEFLFRDSNPVIRYVMKKASVTSCYNLLKYGSALFHNDQLTVEIEQAYKTCTFFTNLCCYIVNKWKSLVWKWLYLTATRIRVTD